MKHHHSMLLIILIILGVLNLSCSDKNSNPVEIGTQSNSDFGKVTLGTESPSVQAQITNGNMEDNTTGYWKGGKSSSGYSFNYTDIESFSPSHSLNINAANTENESFAYWAQTFNAADYVGKKVVMSVMTKYANIDGDGVMFVLRGDDTYAPEGYAEAFSTTQNLIKLVGTSDWKKLEVKLDPVPEGIKSLTVYMLISANTGDVFFDDLDISVESASGPVTNIVNGDAELGVNSPDNWWVGAGSSDKFDIHWDSDNYLSPSHSLAISSDDSGDKFAFWAQTFLASDVAGKKIKVNVFAKADNLTGDGIYVAIRGDDTNVPSGSAEAFVTTQAKVAYNGTFDWKEISITMDTVPTDIKSITVYLIYGTNTSGKVYFDDLSLDIL